MQRVTAVAESEAFDKTCLEGMDEDLLLHPWSAFDTLCWESVTELADSLDALRLPRMPATNSKSLPDVPSDSRSVKSIVDFTGADEVSLPMVSTSMTFPLMPSSISRPRIPGSQMMPHCWLRARVNHIDACHYTSVR